MTRCFNPRARGGRDTDLHLVLRKFLCFNPRARGGRDPVPWSPTSTRVSFNPRARGGRDFPFLAHDVHTSCFNPRARGGRDPLPRIAPKPMALFQSTRPRGARRIVPLPELAYSMFQSTRPRGARLAGDFKRIDSRGVSIHAPAGGATVLGCY